MKLKSIRVALTACAAAVLVAGCAKETEEDEGVDLTKQARAAAAAAGVQLKDGGDGGELHIYTWSDYIAPDVLKSFEKALGVTVVVVSVETNCSRVLS